MKRFVMLEDTRFFTRGRIYYGSPIYINDEMTGATLVTDDDRSFWVGSHQVVQIVESPEIENPDGSVTIPLDMPVKVLKELAAQRVLEILKKAVEDNFHGNLGD